MPKAAAPQSPSAEIVPATEQSAVLASIGPQLTALVEAFQVNMGGSKLNLFSIDRLKVPSGGATTWEYDGAEGPVSAKTFRGILIASQPARSMYLTREVKSQPPDCASTDGVRGYGQRGIPNETGGPYDCATCPLAQGFGCQCKPRELDLVLIENGGPMPFFLNLPPTSLGNAQKFKYSVCKRARPGHVVPFWHVVVNFGLEKDTNAKGIFARVTFETVEVLSPGDAEKIDQYKRAIDGLLQSVKPAEVFAPEAEPETTAEE